MTAASRLLLSSAAFLLAGAASAQPADFTPQQRTVYENYRLSIDVRSSSGYIARPVGASGAYNITRYQESSWHPRRGGRRVTETSFYEAAGQPEVVSYIRRERGSDLLHTGAGLAMIGAAAGLAAVANPDFTESGPPNAALMGVLFLGIGGSYYAYTHLMGAMGNQTSASAAAAAADRYNAILIEEIRRAGPNAGAGGR